VGVGQRGLRAKDFIVGGVGIAPEGFSSYNVRLAQMYSGSSVRSHLILSVVLALHSPTEKSFMFT
jgi:hypothetical protein